VAGVDRKTEAYCAAKLLRQCDAGELLRFVREQSVRLAHPNIVSPYSWAAEDGTVLIASELVAGGSLHTLVGDYGPLAEGTVVTVLRQLLAGLQAVHDAELITGPSNRPTCCCMPPAPIRCGSCSTTSA